MNNKIKPFAFGFSTGNGIVVTKLNPSKVCEKCGETLSPNQFKPSTTICNCCYYLNQIETGATTHEQRN